MTLDGCFLFLLLVGGSLDSLTASLTADLLALSLVFTLSIADFACASLAAAFSCSDLAVFSFERLFSRALVRSAVFFLPLVSLFCLSLALALAAACFLDAFA